MSTLARTDEVFRDRACGPLVAETNVKYDELCAQVGRDVACLSLSARTALETGHVVPTQNEAQHDADTSAALGTTALQHA